MDPLSISASIIAVVTAAGKIAQGADQILALKDASTELAQAMNEVSSLQGTLRAVDVSLVALENKDDSHTQDILKEIDALRLQASFALSKLDKLLNEKLQKPRTSSNSGTISDPKVAKWAWMRHQRNLAQLQSQIRAITQNLSTALAALNSLLLRGIRQPRPLVWTIQGLSLVGSPSTTAASNDQTVIQLDQVLRQITPPQSSQQVLSPATTQDVNQKAIQDTSQVAVSQSSPATLPGLDSEQVAVEPQSNLEREQDIVPYTHSSPHYVRVVASTATDTCDRFCQCQCHAKSHLATPEWARYIFGSFYVQTNSVGWLNRRACNFRFCKRSGKTSAQITYYAPAWMFARAMCLNIERASLGGLNGSVAFKMPRLVNRADWRAVHYIYSQNEERLVDCLVKGETSIYDVDENGWSLLHMGADPFLCVKPGIIPFDYSLRPITSSNSSSHLSHTTAMMLSIFDSVDGYDAYGFTPLHRIAVGLSSANLEAQLDLSVSDINAIDCRGRTALYWAASRGSAHHLQVLLKYGADFQKPDIEGVTPLHVAVRKGTGECVEILLAVGADVNTANSWHSKPINDLFRAYPRNLVCKINALIAYGADLDVRDMYGNTPLHGAYLVGGRTETLECLQQYILHGGDINAMNDQGWSPAMEAVHDDNWEALEMLIDCGARLDLLSAAGKNILQIAVLYGNRNCWVVLGKAAELGKLRNVDANPQHRDHGIMDCLGACRDKLCSYPRKHKDEERELLSDLLAAIERSQAVVELDSDFEELSDEELGSDGVLENNSDLEAHEDETSRQAFETEHDSEDEFLSCDEDDRTDQ